MRSFIKIHHGTNIYLSSVNAEHKKSMRQRHMSAIAGAGDPVAVPAPDTALCKSVTPPPHCCQWYTANRVTV